LCNADTIHVIPNRNTHQVVIQHHFKIGDGVGGCGYSNLRLQRVAKQPGTRRNVVDDFIRVGLFHRVGGVLPGFDGISQPAQSATALAQRLFTKALTPK
jgi:hypothetical protein